MDAQPPSPEARDLLLHPVVWASGMAGALVSLAHAKGLTLIQKFTTVFVGVMTAGFLTPGAAEYLNLSVNLVAAAGFLFGISGMLLTAIVFNAATTARDNPRRFFIEALKLLSGLGKVPAPPPAPPPDPDRPENTR